MVTIYEDLVILVFSGRDSRCAFEHEQLLVAIKQPLEAMWKEVSDFYEDWGSYDVILTSQTESNDYSITLDRDNYNIHLVGDFTITREINHRYSSEDESIDCTFYMDFDFNFNMLAKSFERNW